MVSTFGKGNCSSKIQISGSTNINTFSLKHTGGIHVLPSSANPAQQNLSDEIEIKIPVKGFDSDNPFLLRDFYHLLQAGTFPDIIIRIKKSQLMDLFRKGKPYSQNVAIILAGREKIYETRCLAVPCSSQGIMLYGNHVIKLSDFNLDPPVKSFGLIKVNNDVMINFELIIPNEQKLL
jgi:hypothetical protein